MRLIDVVNSPWALTPDKLDEIVGVYMTHLRGEKIDIAGLEARLGASLPGPTKGYEVRDHVAIVPIDGVLAKRATMLQRMSGGTSLEILHDDLKAAIADPSAHAIVLYVDSPGGATMGLQEAGEVIYGQRGSGKQIVALTDGAMASAAYWLGSCAEQVFISSDMTLVGSIGILYRHVDMSQAREKSGVKEEVVYAGKYKTMASDGGPLSDEARADIQAKVDTLYRLFVDTVARNRGADAQTVLEKMAEGRVFLGREAIKAGLVDGVSTLDGLIEALNTGRVPRPTTAPVRA